MKEASDMVRRMTPSQFNSMLRQAQQKQRQAIDRYNVEVRRVNQHNQAEARRVNQHNQRVVDNYNRAVRTHNDEVRRNRQRLQSELARLERQQNTRQYVTVRTSVETLHRAFVRVEEANDAAGYVNEGDAILDLAEAETANSAHALNALLDPTADVDAAGLQETSISTELQQIEPDLDQRWRGALFALHPRNPDAARHFCTSARELLVGVLDHEAPDSHVLREMPNCEKRDDGRPTRRSKVQFLLVRRGRGDQALEDFVETDLDDVVSLFRVFNDGTHGRAGTFNLSQLVAIKQRVEGAIRFVHTMTR
jgi:hypothetical protein